MKIAATLLLAVLLFGCNVQPSSDELQQDQQERILSEGTAQTGMPAITNFRERRTLKMIYELRDQEKLHTITYILPQNTGELVYLCDSLGYAINDATGYTNPEKVMRNGSVFATMPQAEPNGLFTPDSGNSYWVTCLLKDKPQVVFVAAPILVSPTALKN